MDEILLETKDISKSFFGNAVLNNISFSCKKGEVHALLGENGAGKSTLMKIISGVHPPTSGQLFLEGKEIGLKDTMHALKLGISIIHQEFNLIPYLSVGENIFLGSQPTKNGFIDAQAIDVRVKQLADKLGVTISSDDLVQDLSVAQQQMVEIMKALNVEAKMIIMDEPTAALTPQEVKALFAIIDSLKAEGKTIIFISHRLNEVFEIMDRITVIKDGAMVGTVNKEDTSKDEVVSMMVGRQINNIYPERPASITGKVVLEVKDLIVKEGFRPANFQLRSGEILGITGLEGQGQRELARAIFGLHPIISGHILLHGSKAAIPNPKAAFQHKIAFLTDDRKQEGLCLALPIYNNITLPILKKIRGNGFLTRSKEKNEAKVLAQALNVKAASLDTEVQNLSGGNQQKVALARCLATKPDILIVNEPTRGIDIGAKMEIYSYLRKLADNGTAIILLSSDLLEVIHASDRILVVYAGGIKGEVAPQDATEEKIIGIATGVA
jgi:ABC-type sugar transport system ATPase subunit